MVYMASHTDFQERLQVIHDPVTGVIGIIAIHSTALGPAVGGCRLWHYGTPSDLTADAVRLARGMSYKNAMAGLPFGGGKAVLQLPARDYDRTALLRAFAESVAALDGQYVTAEDVGTTVTDMKIVRQHTRYVAGLDAELGKAGGDPSPWTALGVFEAMKSAAEFCFQADLKGMRVAVQGVGNVGLGLCRLLKGAGASLVIADVDDRRAASAAHDLGATVVDPREIAGVDADIFAPCALGGALSHETIPRLRARLVCGGANNQLATPADGHGLADRGIAYAPDYVVNAGGIINVAAEYLGETSELVSDRVSAIAPRLIRLMEESRLDGLSTHVVADRLARRIIAERPLKAAA